MKKSVKKLFRDLSQISAENQILTRLSSMSESKRKSYLTNSLWYTGEIRRISDLYMASLLLRYRLMPHNKRNQFIKETETHKNVLISLNSQIRFTDSEKQT